MRKLALWLLVVLTSSVAFAQRAAVLKQIDLPHNYYFREMYLPQLTGSPSAVTFAPDGKTLVFSMMGSLWKQSIGSETAEQLTAGPGYDHQPDWSPDGKRIAFVRYNEDALELMALEVASGEVTALTRNRAVNVEPRWSPDGSRLAWVSTQGSGHFHIFVGAVTAQGVTGRPVWPERRSRVARYYYSPFDHEISPTWSPDGKELIYVSNPENMYGTGGIWRRALATNAEPIPIRLEETTWKARPAWSPDGKRVLYSSYAGRQRHAIWITTAAADGDPFPLTYGDVDSTDVRWSPDGSRFAFISNTDLSTEIWLQDAVGGARSKVKTESLIYKRPMTLLRLGIVDQRGKPLSARVSVVGSDGRTYVPHTAWVHADDSFDRRQSPFETVYFHVDGNVQLDLPPGPAAITVWRGLENRITRQTVEIDRKNGVSAEMKVQPLTLPAGWSEQWLSADVHTHMNYGGTYRGTPQTIVRQANAEDLDVVFNLVVNKEQRIPDIEVFSKWPDGASTPAVLLSHGQEFHTSYWGHLGLLGLNDHFLLPDYSGYANTAAASLYPTNGAVADLAHAQKALVGYVHPFDEMPDPGKTSTPLTNALPVDVARGKVDYYEVVGFSDHKTSAAVWHRLLNCGFTPAAAAGTDAMTNYASLRGPVGMNRVYALVPQASSAPDNSTRAARWLDALRAGHTMATNGPLIGLTVDGQPPGSQLAVKGRGSKLRYDGFLRSIAPIDHLELVMNGKVVRSLSMDRSRTQADFSGTIEVPERGWLLVRAWNDGASPQVFDIYPYGTTNAVFFSSPGAAIHCGADAQYFLDWIGRLESAAVAHEGYNTPAERDATLAEIREARQVFSERR